MATATYPITASDIYYKKREETSILQGNMMIGLFSQDTLKNNPGYFTSDIKGNKTIKIVNNSLAHTTFTSGSTTLDWKPKINTLSRTTPYCFVIGWVNLSQSTYGLHTLYYVSNSVRLLSADTLSFGAQLPGMPEIYAIPRDDTDYSVQGWYGYNSIYKQLPIVFNGKKTIENLYINGVEVRSLYYNGEVVFR